FKYCCLRRAGARWGRSKFGPPASLRLKISPGVAHDFVYFAVPRLPAKSFAKPCGVRHQLSGVALAAGRDVMRHALTRDLLHGAQHFHHGYPLAGSDVEGAGRATRHQVVERGQMRGCEVRDVDVVADAGAVGRGVVAAKNPDWLAGR